jgi:uncharacterized iron-regulated membrane protein
MRAAHNWLGLLLAAQVLLWMLSGAVMSLFHIDLVRGRTNALNAFPVELGAFGYANIGGVVAQTPGATEVTLTHFMNKQVYRVTGIAGAALYDAQTAERLSPLNEDLARAVARQDFVGTGDIVRAALLESAPHECGCEAPVWRIDFSDRLDTRIYVSPATGEIEARRNNVWRIYDFFWMLHIMDYKGREDFNNPLVQTFAVSGTLFALSGIWLVAMRLVGGKYRIWRGGPARGGPGAPT